MGRAIIILWRIFATLSGLAVISSLLVMVFLEDIIMRDRPLKPADHAIVLDGNNMRLLRAKDLLDQGLVKDIYVSNGEPFKPDAIDEVVSALGYSPPDRTSIKVDILQKLGVARDKIIVFGSGSLTTRDEAKSLAAALGPGPHRLIVVTTNYHSQRAYEIFQRALPEADIGVACPGGCVAPPSWWKDPAVSAQFILEFVKHIYFRLGMAPA